MPSYELAMIIRKMPRSDTISALKRTAECILDKSGIIRKIENLGSRALPHKISEHGMVHKEGIYLNIAFDTAPSNIADLSEELGRDVDIVRRNFFKIEEPIKYDCTLHEEMLPPAYRKDVNEMIEMAKKNQKKEYKYNSGFDYYPFQK